MRKKQQWHFEDNRAIKYRIHPTKDQEVLFEKTFSCVRKVWNLMMSDEQEFYAATDTFYIPTPAHYKKSFPFLSEVDSLALANAQLDLKAAYRSHFKDPKNFGMPNFKSKKKSKLSYTTNGNIRIGNGEVFLPKAGWVKAVIHRHPRNGWKLKSMTISKTKSGKYYCSALFEFPYTPKDPAPYDNAIGLDYSSGKLFVDSNNNIPEMPHYYREAEIRLAKLQHDLSRMRKGSKNYEKQKVRIAKLSEHVANQRKDFLHKRSTAITKQYDVVGVEDLNLRTMAQTLHLGKSTNDNGFGEFRTMLKYKLKAKGKHYVVIDKWYPSSKLCHNCGHKNPTLSLNERVWECPNCKNIIDRDWNAAQNIRDEALRILTSPAVTGQAS